MALPLLLHKYLAFLQNWLNHKRNLMNHKNSKNKANTKKYIKKWERKSGVICNFTTNKIVAFELWRQRVLPDVSMVHSSTLTEVPLKCFKTMTSKSRFLWKLCCCGYGKCHFLCISLIIQGCPDRFMPSITTKPWSDSFISQI